MHIQRVQMTLQQERYISEDNSMLSSVRTKSLQTAQEDLSAHSSSPTDSTVELGPSTTDIPFVNHGLFCSFLRKKDCKQLFEQCCWITCFCNEGLLQWNEQRQLWVGDRSHVNPKCQCNPTVRLIYSVNGIALCWELQLYVWKIKNNKQLL